MFRFVRSRLIPKTRQWCAPAATVALLFAIACSAHAQNVVRADNLPAALWAKAAANNQVRIVEDTGTFPVRYRVRRIDRKGDITREVIECNEGTVARLIERNGQPLTPEQDTAERNRLNAILTDPTDFFQHQKRNASAKTYASDLIKLLPTAMLYDYTPGQPQPPGARAPQVVVDFRPDPNFKPPNTVSELLTGLEGRMWIDKQQQRLTRVQGRVIKPVNFGFGVLAHVYPGGTFEFEQTEAAPGRWIYSHTVENFTVREMMLHTAQERTEMTASDIHALPAKLSYREAIEQLLALPVALR